MDKETNRLVELALAWCGPAFVVGYIIFWAILGHYIPPPNMMGMTPEQMISEYYGKYQTDIEIGMIGCCVIGLLYLPWSIVLATKLRNEDGTLGALSYMEMAGGLLTGWLLAFCPAMWAACAFFATTMEPATIKLLHVTTWFIYDCTFMITTIQTTGLGVYTILNKKQTLFPAWAGWCTIAVGITFFPLVLMPFVPGGPFGVGGTWNFFVVFSVWLFLFFSPYAYFLLKSLRKEEGPALSAAHSR
ncbi:MAG: hypothetical protein WC073_14065 [Sterolibacterium sp.]